MKSLLIVIAFVVLLFLYVVHLQRMEHFHIMGIDMCQYTPDKNNSFVNFQWLRDMVCGPGGCPEDKEKVAGLCYTPCQGGYNSDGAMMCYKQYNGFEGQPGNTLLTILKKTQPVLGKIPVCDGNQDKDAGLCYNKCDTGFHGVGPLCWPDTSNVGIGQAMHF